MLNAGVFDDFKGATTLLLWGDLEGVASLGDSFSALRGGSREEFSIDGSEGSLKVCLAQEGSTLRAEGSCVRWDCSRETIESAADAIEPLLARAGHQFLEVNGLAQQVIIARDQYPANLL